RRREDAAGPTDPTMKETRGRDDRPPGAPRAALMGILRSRPVESILSGDSADVYFQRANRILERVGLDPLVTMEVFARQSGILCGIDEVKNLLAYVLADADPAETLVEALDDGDPFEAKEVVLRIRARYRKFGLYETAILGMLAQATGWATAARECVEAAAPEPVISFGARHVHPKVSDVLDYAAIVGGCVGASTPAGARLAGLSPTGTMPHALVLIFGDTVEAARAFDRELEADVPRIVLVDTFKDEAEESLRVAHALGDRLFGIRLDTPAERGRVTADLVKEVRARLDLAGFRHVKIVVSGGLTPDRIRYFKEQAAPVDSFAVGSYISGAGPIDFTGDIKEIEGRPIAKRGRIPGITPSARLREVRLADWRVDD
ncbi:MAG TPA: nicotinate phosphoribosyltransferase, partial [Candidatus Limnocylindrales bacterium]|nr:nicotinate phosphoribosyltransferase [Candidatus Limnocylindrales bacterium]